MVCLCSKDPTKPKRAMSAFFLYSQANRAQVKADNPEASFGDVVSQSENVRLSYRIVSVEKYDDGMICL